MLCAVKKKLNSQRGASLSIALLLFLVCLAVSSVVLTAGTAAAGRLSELKEMDQRYYSVTSAAELVRDLVTEAPVEFTQTKTTTTVSGTTTVTVQTDIGDSVLKAAAAKLVFGDDVNTMDAWLLSADPGTYSEDFVITPGNDQALKVACRAKIENGDLVFYFKNAEDGATDAFCLKLTCTPEAPKAGAATAYGADGLRRKVTVQWKAENCLIERTGNWS